MPRLAPGPHGRPYSSRGSLVLWRFPVLLSEKATWNSEIMPTWGLAPHRIKRYIPRLFPNLWAVKAVSTCCTENHPNASSFPPFTTPREVLFLDLKSYQETNTLLSHTDLIPYMHTLLTPANSPLLGCRHLRQGQVENPSHLLAGTEQMTPRKQCVCGWRQCSPFSGHTGMEEKLLPSGFSCKNTSTCPSKS